MRGHRRPTLNNRPMLNKRPTLNNVKRWCTIVQVALGREAIMRTYRDGARVLSGLRLSRFG